MEKKKSKKINVSCLIAPLFLLNASDTTILILSPDTEVYHIGRPLVAHTNLDIIVQLSKFNNRELRLLNMKAESSDPCI